MAGAEYIAAPKEPSPPKLLELLNFMISELARSYRYGAIIEMPKETDFAIWDDVMNFGPALDLYPAGFLSGRQIFITGFESGVIAFMIAKFMIEHGGAEVCVHGRNREVLDEAIALLEKPPAHSVVADFRDLSTIAPMVSQAQQPFEKPFDTFVHVAGLTAYSPLEDVCEEFRAPIRNVNIHAAEEIFAALLPGMRSLNRAWVCLFSSIHSAFPYPNNLTYRQTKKDIELLAQNIAYEYGCEGINANAIAPGWVVVHRHFSEAHYADMCKARDEAIPSRRLGYPIDYAMAVSWLCSEAARYINGVTLPIDGGHHLVNS